MIKQIKGRWKRAVSSLMALVIAAGLLPGSAFAAEPPDPVHKETAYAPTGSFELNVAGATAWAGGEDALTVYATESGTTQAASIPADVPFVLLEEGETRLKIGYNEGGWTGGALEDTGWVDKADVLVNLPDLLPSIAYVREDAEPQFSSRLTRFEYVIPAPYTEAERLAQLQAEAMDGEETLVLRMEGQTVTITRGVGEPASLEEYSLDGETYQKYNQWTDSSVDSGISAYHLPYEVTRAYSADPSVTLGMFAPQQPQPNRAPANAASSSNGDVGAYNPGSPGGKKPSTTNVAWSINPERTFLRFTLIEFPQGVVTDLNIEVKVLVIEIGYIEGYRSHGIARAVYGSHVGLQHFKRHRVVVHIAQRNCLRIMVIVYVYIEIYGVLRLIVFIFVRFVAHSVIDNFGCLGINVEVKIERAVIGILRRIVRPALHAGEHSLHMNEVLPVA